MGSIPKGISASRGAAILGRSDFQSPFEVWQRIMEEREPGFNNARGYVLPKEPDSAAIRWGTVFESAICKLAVQAQDRNIIYRECFYEAPDMKYVTCHIDGIYFEDLDRISGTDSMLHEGKTTSAFVFRENWGEPGTDHIPRAYQIQVQHQMICTGARDAIVSVLVFPETPDKWESVGWEAKQCNEASLLVNENKCSSKDPMEWAEVLAEMGYFHQYHIHKNNEVQQLMILAYRDFWNNHVLTGKPPEPRNYEDIKRLMPEPKSTIIVPDLIERKIAEYKGINEETATAKKRKERLKTIITKYAAANEGTLDDESKEAVIFRNSSGDKLGSWYKDKNGKLIFRC
jgi:putative phage-type endonuclease